MNINNNSNYPITLNELPAFQSHKKILINTKENENLNTDLNYAQSNNVTTAIPNNTVVVENSKLHAFTRFRYSNELRKKYEDHLEKTNHSEKELNIALNKLRNMIYEFGLPDGSEIMMNSYTASLRGKIWKILLGVYRVSASEYLKYVGKRKSKFYEKIKNDGFRTLRTDEKFKQKVTDNMIVRLLNAFVWSKEKEKIVSDVNCNFTYVQGMNVIAAPFLYVLPEMEAFYAFSTFIQYYCPLYVHSSLIGAHAGAKLLDICLEIIDPELYDHLTKNQLTAEIYAFSSILSFSACTPPLQELLCLWDFLFAFGVHLNIIFVISQMIIIREELLNEKNPYHKLRNFPNLNAKLIIAVTISLIPKIPKDIYTKIVKHTYDYKTVEELLK